MLISDIIQLSGIIIALVTGIISIIISVFTLKQNSKMIEESTRAYICIYGDTVNFQSLTYYLILKNFGQSGAVITDFHFTPNNAFETSQKLNAKFFDHIRYTSLALGQSIRYPVKFKDVHDITNTLQFDIRYSCNGKSYTEKSIINLDARLDTYSSKASTSGKELEIISYTLQEFVERSL